MLLPMLDLRGFASFVDSFFNEEILTPLHAVLRVVAKHYSIKPDAQFVLRSQKRHTRLLRRAIAFTVIAPDARRDEVLRR